VRFGSVCSGIEAASVAWHPLGWRAAWLAEIEAFPSAILAHHYPDVPNLGDMTAIAARITAGEVEPPDVLVGGTPCQAFSVAGLRGGLTDERGALTLAFVRLADAIDAARSVRRQQPAVIVWENVPGVLSTKDNAFGCFLAGLAGEDVPLVAAGGKWPDAGLVVGPARAVAWRVLDAQFFGVAQRRRRVFVVASARDRFDPGAVLFEFDGVRRDTPPVRETREDPTGTLAGGARKRGGYSTDDVPLTPEWPAQIASTLNASFGSKQGLEDQHIRGGRPSLCPPMTMAHGQGGAEIAENRAPTLTCNHEAPILFLGGRFDEVAHTLRGEGFDASEDGTGRGTPLIPVPFRKVRRAANAEDAETWEQAEAANTLNCFDVGDVRATTIAAQPAAFNVYPARGQGGDLEASPASVSPSLHASRNERGTRVAHAMRVRRLTPRECERLQGFPDDYTRIPVRFYKAKPRGKHFDTYPDLYDRLPDGRWARYLADGPRYKALGNSMAVPVMRWIGSRIAGALATPANDNRQQAGERRA